MKININVKRDDKYLFIIFLSFNFIFCTLCLTVAADHNALVPIFWRDSIILLSKKMKGKCIWIFDKFTDILFDHNYVTLT